MESGCQIVERHPHSMVVPGSAAAVDRDATVAWNYVDLQFRPRQDICLDVRLTATEIVVRFLARTQITHAPVLTRKPELSVIFDAAKHTCTDCQAHSCFRHRPRASKPTNDVQTAYLLDEPWPEFVQFVTKRAAAHDVIAIPMRHGRYRTAHGSVRNRKFITAALPAIGRGAAVRFAKSVPERVRSQLLGSENIARFYAKRIPYQATHLVVAQSFLPYLWRDGTLGGRTFDVLMTRPPLNDLHLSLDEAAALWPERITLREYRAPQWLAAAESEALAHAAKIVTPHASIAKRYADRSLKLDWQLPQFDRKRGEPQSSSPARRSRGRVHSSYAKPSETLSSSFDSSGQISKGLTFGMGRIWICRFFRLD